VGQFSPQHQRTTSVTQDPTSDLALTNVPTITGEEPVYEATPTGAARVNVSTSSGPSMSILSLQKK
jgi:hypothetical protein